MGLHVQALQNFRASESKLSVEMQWKRKTAKQLLETREHAPSLAAQANKVSFFLSTNCHTPMSYHTCGDMHIQTSNVDTENICSKDHLQHIR